MNRVDRKPKPELMSPAGHWPELEAAIASGADAVYFGLQHFTARAKVGFTIAELPKAIRALHRNGVKGFVTFNTLVFDHELKQACTTIADIADSGADAIIVQDIGIAKLAKQIAPDLDIHGSTQMSITSAEGADLAASLGCSRVVLGRELSLKDIRKIAMATEVELETFVHGALCVSYSGQCFSSEAWGGRSANRGQCAQACRLSYDLIVDGQPRELDEFRYLLSPGDLYALDQIPELTEIGISCFKIEGRYKGPDYVALTTKAYREAIDRSFDSLESPMTISKNDLEQVYSRGLGAHFVAGVDHQKVVHGRAPRHRGLKVGTVSRIEKSAIVVSTDHQILPGDGLVFDSAGWRSPDQHEEGGHVYQVEILSDGQCRIGFGHGNVDLTRIQIDDWVWRTHDPKLKRKAKRILTEPGPTTGIEFHVVAAPGQSLQINATTDDGESVVFKSEKILEAATNRALDEIQLERQLARLGGTPFHLRAVIWQPILPVFCPVSLLNQARRKLVAELVEQREKIDIRANRAVIEKLLPSVDQTENSDSPDVQPSLHLLVRNQKQLDAAIACQPTSITLDYLELYGLRPSVDRIRTSGIIPRVASPRILKPSEQKVVRFLLSLECALLIRSGGLLHDLVSNERYRKQLPELYGDFSLNTANAVALSTYLKMGLTRITPSYDLNTDQVSDLFAMASPQQLEVVAFQHLPVFHTEHCVFCRFLSDGTDHTNCGHPCEKHEISVRDSNGRRHAVLADVGCRNTVFGAEAQFSVTSLEQWSKQGILNFRVEFVDHSNDQVDAIGSAFAKYLVGHSDASELDKIIRSQSAQGTTEGSLYVPRDFKQLVQLS